MYTYIFQVHFEVQPKDFREHQGIIWNMENDGIKWNMVEYGSCLKHFGFCDDLKSVKIPDNPRPPPPKLWKGVGEGEETNVT